MIGLSIGLSVSLSVSRIFSILQEQIKDLKFFFKVENEKKCLLCNLNIKTIIVEPKVVVKSSLAFILATMF